MSSQKNKPAAAHSANEPQRAADDLSGMDIKKLMRLNGATTPEQYRLVLIFRLLMHIHSNVCLTPDEKSLLLIISEQWRMLDALVV